MGQTKENESKGILSMKKISFAIVGAAALGLAACGGEGDDALADEYEDAAENEADALEEAADNAATEAQEEALEEQADAVEEAGEEMEDAVDDADPIVE